MIRESEDRIPNRFLCQRCGWCCTNLGVPVETIGGIGWINDYGGRRYGFVSPLEKERFQRDLAAIGSNEDLPVFEFWVDSKQKLAIICSYMFPNDRCHFFDKAQRLCSVYERRPFVCRIFPITSCDMEKGVSVDVSNCPESRRIFSPSSSEGVVACPEGTTFGTIFGDYLYWAVFASVMKEFANTFIGVLHRSNRIRLLPFKPREAKRVITGKEFTKIDVNTLYEQMERRSFLEYALSLFQITLKKQFVEASSQGFRAQKTAEQVAKDIRDSFQQ